MTADKALRDDVVVLLRGGRAHVGFEQVIAGVPVAAREKKPRGAPYTLWQQLEHIRIVQWDILEYIRNPHHVSPQWPEGYWPEDPSPAGGAWAKSVKAFQADRQALLDMTTNPATDLLARIPPGDPDGVTILHELLLVADHNAYHLGQMVVLRRLLQIWQE